MRAAIFIDAGHFLVQVGDAKIEPDYAKLADFLLAPLRRAVPLDLLRCYFYYCPPWMSHKPTEIELRRKAEWDKFVGELESQDRWQVRLGKLEKRREGGRDVYSQKRVDVLLSVDMVRHAAAGHLQHAILVAGDSDFIPAVEAVKESGATVTLWAAPDKSAHLDLIRAADEVQFFDWAKLPQKKGSKAGGRSSVAKSAGALMRALLSPSAPPPNAADADDGSDDQDVADVQPLPTPRATGNRRGGRGRAAAPAPKAPLSAPKPQAPAPKPRVEARDDYDDRDDRDDDQGDDYGNGDGDGDGQSGRAEGDPAAPKKKRRRGRRGGRGRNKRPAGTPQ